MNWRRPRLARLLENLSAMRAQASSMLITVARHGSDFLDAVVRFVVSLPGRPVTWRHLAQLRLQPSLESPADLRQVVHPPVVVHLVQQLFVVGMRASVRAMFGSRKS